MSWRPTVKPADPWGVIEDRKLLLREAMRGRLPKAVLARKKAPLAGSPFAEPIRIHGLPDLSGDERLKPYVDVGALPKACAAGPALDRLMAVHALDHWLGQRPQGRIAPGTAPL